MAKRICRNCKKYLSKLWNVFVEIMKCICPKIPKLVWMPWVECCFVAHTNGADRTGTSTRIHLDRYDYSSPPFLSYPRASHKIIVGIHSELSTPASPFQKSHKDTRYHGAVHTLYHVLIFYLINFQRRREFVLLADCLLNMHTLTLNNVDNHKISKKNSQSLGKPSLKKYRNFMKYFHKTVTPPPFLHLWNPYSDFLP